MTRQELREKVQRDVPEVIDYWTNAQINSELDLAAIQVAYDTFCIPHNTTLNVTSGTSTYDLGTLITNFLRLDPKGGVSWYDGSQWTKLRHTTPDELDKEKVYWRTVSDGDPEAFWMEGAELNLYPGPDTTTANALVVYCSLKPTAMSGDSSDPFNSIGYLEPLHPLVCLLVEAEGKRSKSKWDDYYKIMAPNTGLYAMGIQKAMRFIGGDFEGDYFPDIKRVSGYQQHFRSRDRR